MSENEKNEEDLTNKNKFYYVLAFIPFANLSILFLDIDKDELLKKFLTQWLTLLLVFIILNMIIIVFWFLLWWFSWILSLIYFILSIFLAWNAFNWNYIDLWFIQKVSDIFWANKKNKENK